MEFKQFDLKLNRKKFTIEKDGLRAISKSISGSSEDYYDFEDIGDKITRKKRRLLIPLFISILFFAYGTILLVGTINGGEYGDYAVPFYYVTGIIFFSAFFFFGKDHLYISNKRNTSHIQFINNNPSKKKLTDFIENLQVAQRNRLLEKYAEYDEYKTYEEHRNHLKWLKDNDYLEKIEYRQKLTIINQQFGFSEEGEDEEESNSEIGYRTKN
jgi:hypothetical protein